VGPDLEKPRRNKASGVWGTSETEGDSCGVRYRQHILPITPTPHQDTNTGEETTSFISNNKHKDAQKYIWWELYFISESLLSFIVLILYTQLMHRQSHNKFQQSSVNRHFNTNLQLL
jgi:hypothetical protein